MTAVSLSVARSYDVDVVVADVGDPLAVGDHFGSRIVPGRVFSSRAFSVARSKTNSLPDSGSSRNLPASSRWKSVKPPALTRMPLAAGLLLGRQLLLAALEQRLGGEQLARLAGGDVELEQAPLRDSSAGERRNRTCLPSGVGFGLTGRPRSEAAGLGVVAQERGVERLGHGGVGPEGAGSKERWREGECGFHGVRVYSSFVERATQRLARGGPLARSLNESYPNLHVPCPEHLAPRDSLLARRDPRWRLAAFGLAIARRRVPPQRCVRWPSPSGLRWLLGRRRAACRGGGSGFARAGYSWPWCRS